ncbi:hypothetical protein ALC57_17940 [Trachymyrmex cornetzi]|uniref:Uncharacterized protein n=1 Tax=Trachymyrmex cornetzi TaxID=471704 RepID=A0A195DAN0_9HYME|nr:hypothetical protein ALC57_17940 [Trachymyrmex cornetzi]
MSYLGYIGGPCSYRCIALDIAAGRKLTTGVKVHTYIEGGRRDLKFVYAGERKLSVLARDQAERGDRSQREGKEQMSEYQLGNVYVARILYLRDIRRTRAESVGGAFVVRIIASFKQDSQKLSTSINGCTERTKE